MASSPDTAADCRSNSSSSRSSAAAYGEKEPAFTAECPHPAKLRHPSLERPVVVRRRKEIVGFVAEHGARVAPHEFDVVLGEPLLHLRQRVAMFLRMLILVAQPRVLARRLAA